jgi:hypothetical protein
MTVTPLIVMLWSDTDTVIVFPLALAAVQMEPSGTILVLSQRQSLAAMVSLLKNCDTVCVVGEPPSVQPAHEH